MIVEIECANHFPGIFLKSEFGKAINDGQFNIPPPKPLPDSDVVLPHVIVGDEAFALHPNLMKPYPRPQALHDQSKAKYNYRHSRARRTSENTFGITASYFRVLHTPIGVTNPETIDHIIVSCCILHNMMRTEKITAPAETTFGSTVDESNLPTQNLMPLAHVRGRPVDNAAAVRNKFKDYFEGPGAVEWQDRMVQV